MSGEFIPTIWSALVDKAFQKSLVYGSCANTDYSGTIAQAGDSVKINEIGSITVAPYVEGTTTVTYQDIPDASKSLKIDQSKYFAFQVADVNAAQSNPKLIGPATEQAGYDVADTIDQYLASLYTKSGIVTNLGTTAIPIEVNSENVRTYLLKMGRMLDDAKVPRSGRWAVLPPWMIEDLVKADATLSTDNVGIVQNGIVGQSCGFTIKMSQNVPNTTSTKYRIIAGVNRAMSFASQISEVESIRLEGSFRTGVRGLYLFGADVLHPDCLACLTANEAAEPA